MDKMAVYLMHLTGIIIVNYGVLEVLKSLKSFCVFDIMIKQCKWMLVFIGTYFTVTPT